MSTLGTNIYQVSSKSERWPYSFCFITTNILNIVWNIALSWVTKTTVAHHCFNGLFQWLKTVNESP